MNYQDAREIYAQSSDIKSRTYLEYRKDMKRKAIAELEVLPWLEEKLRELNPNKQITVRKSGGDRFLWFLRKGGITREPDFIAEIDGQIVEFEFQYADKEDLKFYDFKISKIVKRKHHTVKPIEGKFFIYIHKPLLKYAIITPKWIMENGIRGFVEAWRSEAFRVPKEKFEEILLPDKKLEKVCYMIDVKNFILEFQHQLIDILKQKLSKLLQSVIDQEKILKMIPRDLESFFEICFILDNLNKIPENIQTWFLKALSYSTKESHSLENVAKIVYCLDFLYSKITLQQYELSQLIKSIELLLKKVNGFYKGDGFYSSSSYSNPIEETRYALFSINLLEDLIQRYFVLLSKFSPRRKSRAY